MHCEYDGREIAGKPFKVEMPITNKILDAPDESAVANRTGYLYFHDAACYEMYMADLEDFTEEEEEEIPQPEVE